MQAAGNKKDMICILADFAVLNGYVAKDGVDATRATIRSSLSHEWAKEG
jgi:hypothetical protein